MCVSDPATPQHSSASGRVRQSHAPQLFHLGGSEHEGNAKEGRQGAWLDGSRCACVWNAVGLGVDVVGSTLESILAPLCWVQLGQRGDLKTEALWGFLCFFLGTLAVVGGG